MVPFSLLLALSAVVRADLLRSGSVLDGEQGGSDASSELNAFRIRSRDLLKQGYKLTLHDVKPFTTAAPNEGN
jgi:hypothetical protein